VFVNGSEWDKLVIYTGPLDWLMKNKYGVLPYRSLKFTYETKEVKSFQPAPVVAYPQEEGYTRITEYTKIPMQDFDITKIAVEYPIPYTECNEAEPYYPILTQDSMVQYDRYFNDVKDIHNLMICGRLGKFKYYNMDQALESVLELIK
jgi:UDP-galactopyranose mutase